MDRKKVIIVLVVLIFLFGIVMLFYIFRNARNSSNNSQGLNPIPTQTSLNVSPTPLTSQNSQKYSAGNFSFSYPNSSTIYGTGKDQNGEVVVVSLGGAGSDSAKVELSSFDPSKTTLKQLMDVMEAFKLNKGLVTVGPNIPATQYVGALTLPNGAIQEIATVFAWNNRVYKVQMTYISSQTNSSYTSSYNSILSSFSPF